MRGQGHVQTGSAHRMLIGFVLEEARTCVTLREGLPCGETYASHQHLLPLGALCLLSWDSSVILSLCAAATYLCRTVILMQAASSCRL